MPSALWKRLGADLDQLRAILNTRLILDDRKPMTIGRVNKPKKERKFSTVANFFALFIMGFMYMFPLFIVQDRIFAMAIYFSFLFPVLILTLISDFSNVLFDSRDKYILFPRPVNDRTLVLARMLHVFIYLFRTVLPMVLPGWVVIGILDGWKSVFLFPLPLVSLVFFVLFVVNGAYLIVLRLAKPEKFNDVINYFQVITSVVFFATVYLMPRFMDPEHPLAMNITDHAWMVYSPSYWLAACWSWLGYRTYLPGTVPLSILSIILPVICMVVLMKWLAPEFSRRIAGIDAADLQGQMSGKPAKRAGSRLGKRLAYLFNRNDEARAGFLISWLQTSRSRSFRMRVYPTFAYVPVYFVYLFMRSNHSLTEEYNHMSSSHMNLILLYMSSFALMQALSYLNISDQYKASWVYYATPVQTPGNIMVGAFKALWIKFFLPFFIAIAVFVIYVWGAPAILDVLLALVNVTLFIGCVARINFRHLPFSIMEQTKYGAGKFVKAMLALFIPAILALVHFLSVNVWWLKLTFLFLSVALLWLVLDSYSRTTWGNMLKAETES